MTERRETGREEFPEGGERIAKYLASAGVASRRDIESMIAEGRVSVNGRKLDTPAFKVTGAEKIFVDGLPVARPEATRLWRYHKPAGLVTTNRDPEGRPTIFEALPKFLPRVVTIGRLDLNTEGLLLLTNDGEFARSLELPATGIERKYRARAYGRAQQKDLDRLRDGLVYEGEEYRSIIATVDRITGSNSWIDMTLTEGKKREARRALESLGFKVNRLIRVSYGPMELGDLEAGGVAEVPPADLLAEFSELLPLRRRPEPFSRKMQRPQDDDRKPAKKTDKRDGRSKVKPATPSARDSKSWGSKKPVDKKPWDKAKRGPQAARPDPRSNRRGDHSGKRHTGKPVRSGRPPEGGKR